MLRNGLLPESLSSAVLDEVGDERLLWVGRPRFRDMVIGASIVGALTFSVGVFCLFDRRPDSGVAGSVSLISSLIAFVYAFFIATTSRRTVYCVTTARALILEIGFSRRISSFSRDLIAGLERRERADGSGTLVFDAGELGNTIGFNRNGFYGIDNVAEVERLIRDHILDKTRYDH
jgi:hypothetical protein